VDWPAVLISTGVAAAASVGTAYLAARTATRNQLRQWRAQAAENYATLIADDSGRAQAYARQFAVGFLIVEHEGSAEREKIFVAPHTRMSAGRDLANEILLKTDYASRRQFAISADATRVYVEDLGSSTGVHLNGARVASRAELEDGDVLSVGTARVAFHVLVPNV
jgi:pSer/pThr/pTyr-binding forkhead associated (FHA) protein